MIALILGGAPSVWRELAEAQALLTRRHLVVAANLAGLEYDHPLAGWASLHPDNLGEWVRRKGGTDARLFAPAAHPACPDVEIVDERWPGSSGLYAAQVALFELGATAAVLCGVPMDSEAGHFIVPGSWAGTADYRRGFAAALREVGGRVRSMGGWTGDVFGRSTAEWAEAVENIKPLGATASQPQRATDMHKVTNTGKVSANFWARDAAGQMVLHRLAPGESTEAEIDPDQAKFQGGALSVKALAPAVSKPKAAPKKAATPRKNPARPAPPVSSET